MSHETVSIPYWANELLELPLTKLMSLYWPETLASVTLARVKREDCSGRAGHAIRAMSAPTQAQTGKFTFRQSASFRYWRTAEVQGSPDLSFKGERHAFRLGDGSRLMDHVKSSCRPFVSEPQSRERTHHDAGIQSSFDDWVAHRVL